MTSNTIRNFRYKRYIRFCSLKIGEFLLCTIKRSLVLVTILEDTSAKNFFVDQFPRRNDQAPIVKPYLNIDT